MRKTPMSRVPWNDAAIIMNLLDAGSYGLICAMINTKEQAEQGASVLLGAVRRAAGG